MDTSEVRDLLSDAFFDYDDGVLTISLPKAELRGPDAIDYSAWQGTWSRRMTVDECDAIVAYIKREDETDHPHNNTPRSNTNE